MSETKLQPARNGWKVTFGLLLLPLVLSYVVLLVLISRVHAILLNVAIWSWWCPRGRDVLFIYSDSIASHDYVVHQILPKLVGRAVVLNWSQRQKRGISLARYASYFFCKSRKDCPMAVVFRPFRLSRCFMFRRAFLDLKHGQASALNDMERKLFGALGILEKSDHDNIHHE